jgi:hypothetical protein
MSAFEHLRDLAEEVRQSEESRLAAPRSMSNSSPVEPPVPLGRALQVPAFPVAVLPAWAGEYVTALAHSTQTPPDLSAMLVLAALATAAARKMRVQVRPGWSEPANLYIAVAMPPGSRKSPVFARVTEPLLAWERRALDWAKPDITDASTRKRVAADLVRQAERAVAGADETAREELTVEAVRANNQADDIVVPVEPRLLADDVTPEALARLLAEQGGRMAILSAEGDIFELMAGRYSRNGAANIGVFLKSWSGDDLRVDRVNRTSEHVEQPALTLGLTVQPEILASISRQPGFRGRGLLARFLWSLPPSNVGSRLTNTPAVPEAVEARYGAELEALTTTLAELEEPEVLTFSQAAAERFEEFEAGLEPRLHAESGDLGHIADWGAKLAGHTARIAGLLHLATHLRDGWGRPIGVESVQGAIAIADYLAAHALAVFDHMGADPNVARAEVILRWLERTDLETFTQRECHRALSKSSFPTAADLDAALNLLCSHGWIEKLPHDRPGPRGGRPASPTFIVNTLWCQNRHNRQNLGRDRGCVDSPGVLSMADDA